MNEHEIIVEFAENYRLVSDKDIHEIIGYPEAQDDNSAIAACAAVLTILNHLKED